MMAIRSRQFSTLSTIILVCQCALGVTPDNLALNKTSTLSSTLPGNPAIGANDGDGATRAITITNHPSYWWVDLEEQVNVTFVLLKLGIEVSWDALYVGVGDSPPTNASVPGEDFGVCKNFTGFPGDRIQTIPCDISGRYVIIFSDMDASLELFEVEVYNSTEPGKLGIGQLDPALEKTTIISSTTYGFPASQGNDSDGHSEARTDGTSVPDSSASHYVSPGLLLGILTMIIANS